MYEDVKLKNIKSKLLRADPVKAQFFLSNLELELKSIEDEFKDHHIKYMLFKEIKSRLFELESSIKYLRTLIQIVIDEERR